MTIETTNNDKPIVKAAEHLLRKLWTRRIRIRLIGVHASDFLEDIEQMYLFETPKHFSRIDNVMDSIRNKYGDVIHYGVEEIR